MDPAHVAVTTSCGELYSPFLVRLSGAPVVSVSPTGSVAACWSLSSVIPSHVQLRSAQGIGIALREGQVEFDQDGRTIQCASGILMAAPVFAAYDQITVIAQESHGCEWRWKGRMLLLAEGEATPTPFDRKGLGSDSSKALALYQYLTRQLANQQLFSPFPSRLSAPRAGVAAPASNGTKFTSTCPCACDSLECCSAATRRETLRAMCERSRSMVSTWLFGPVSSFQVNAALFLIVTALVLTAVQLCEARKARLVMLDEHTENVNEKQWRGSSWAWSTIHSGDQGLDGAKAQTRARGTPPLPPATSKAGAPKGKHHQSKTSPPIADDCEQEHRQGHERKKSAFQTVRLGANSRARSRANSRHTSCAHPTPSPTVQSTSARSESTFHPLWSELLLKASPTAFATSQGHRHQPSGANELLKLVPYVPMRGIARCWCALSLWCD